MATIHGRARLCVFIYVIYLICLSTVRSYLIYYFYLFISFIYLCIYLFIAFNGMGFPPDD